MTYKHHNILDEYVHLVDIELVCIIERVLKTSPGKLKTFSSEKALMCLNVVYTVRLNGGRAVSGVLRGFDPYMNIVLDDTVDETSSSEKKKIGMVVSPYIS